MKTLKRSEIRRLILLELNENKPRVKKIDINDSLLIEKKMLLEQIDNLPSAWKSLYDLLSVFMPFTAIFNFFKELLQGNVKEAIFSLPPLNLLKAPDAVYNLIIKGLNMLPSGMKDDILDSQSVNILIELVHSLAEITRPEDLDDFYMKLKHFVRNVKRGGIILAGLFAGLAALCGAIYVPLGYVGTALAGYATVSPEPITKAAAAGAVTVLYWISIICAGAIGFAGAGVGAWIVSTVANIDPNDVDELDRLAKEEISRHLQKMRDEHVSNIRDAMNKSPESQSQPAPDPIDVGITSEPTENLSEGFSVDRWKLLAGIN